MSTNIDFLMKNNNKYKYNNQVIKKDIFSDSRSCILSW